MIDRKQGHFKEVNVGEMDSSIQQIGEEHGESEKK